MKKIIFQLTVVSILFCLAACSGSKDQDEAKEGKKPSTGQAVKAIEEYGAKPIEKARAAQHLGEERTKAIDDALELK